MASVLALKHVVSHLELSALAPITVLKCNDQSNIIEMICNICLINNSLIK